MTKPDIILCDASENILGAAKLRISTDLVRDLLEFPEEMKIVEIRVVRSSDPWIIITLEGTGLPDRDSLGRAIDCNLEITDIHARRELRFKPVEPLPEPKNE